MSPSSVGELTAFLREADLTLSALDDPAVRLWVVRGAADAVGCSAEASAVTGTGTVTGTAIVGSTGYELSADRRHALVRSVAVHPAARRGGLGRRLALAALAAAAAEGASDAWLFSRRSGPFWQSIGFEPADRDALAAALPDAHQVRLFRETGQLVREVAWHRALTSEPR
ncbi:GNAT family N-acetyltransferase [Schumannella soli]|uniref:GNAT family N-acetyltransferase n=1 Tax=Schumannella soli TaxID=2590779 RepID=A0A506XZN3_9MICO|nr:GNAT family N-acetyltransferase [Schumannella soli]TPW75676.1 GNAT family N-acetyltransferase [Schumannella soli]